MRTIIELFICCNCIEGNPFIIRFKTFNTSIIFYFIFVLRIEGNPFIIRFKTGVAYKKGIIKEVSIEGNPFIIRFKTSIIGFANFLTASVLKVIHL